MRDQEKNQSLEIKSFHQAPRFMGLLMDISSKRFDRFYTFSTVRNLRVLMT